MSRSLGYHFKICILLRIQPLPLGQYSRIVAAQSWGHLKGRHENTVNAKFFFGGSTKLAHKLCQTSSGTEHTFW